MYAIAARVPGPFRLLAAVAALLAAGCQPRPVEPGAAGAAGGASAPLLAGGAGSFSLGARRGSVVLLDFFATWSEPCRRELGGLEQISRDLGPKGVAVAGLLLDEGPEEQLAATARSLPVTYPLAQATPGLREAVGGIRVIPTRALIDREGRVVRVYPGAVSADVIRGDVERLLGGEGAAP